MSQLDYDVVVVGAGISGINAGYRLQSEIKGCKYTIFEARDSMGGTWDLFKYPGLRSDSDLHTFGFPWRPWPKERAIADGASIKEYLVDTAAVFGIDKHIKYKHKTLSADWLSASQVWTLTVEHEGKQTCVSTRFMILCTGYYDYDKPLQTEIAGIDNFKGTKVHPQFWPQDLDYSGKRMVVVGSGATAVTLLPSLAEKASHVTMLQRSPGYLVALPGIDPTGALAKRWLPRWLAYRILRLKFLILPFLFFKFCRAYPHTARRLLKRRTQRLLPPDVPISPHFEPKYNPWEQRLCIAPDGDFYKALHQGKTSVRTGHIQTMTPNSIFLEDGTEIPADVIVTATGLKVLFAGGISIFIDGERMDVTSKFLWKGVMLQDLPNAAFVLGYTNASWTLGSDATALHCCRLIKHMRTHGQSSSVPRVNHENQGAAEIQARSPFNLSSTYVKRAEKEMPKAGDRGPWRSRTTYFWDLWEARYGAFEGRKGVLGWLSSVFGMGESDGRWGGLVFYRSTA